MEFFKQRMKQVAGVGLLGGFDRHARPGEGLSKDRHDRERSMFHDMLNRTANIFLPHRYLERNRKDGGPEPTDADTVTIACVSSHLDIWSRRNLDLEYFRDGCRLLRAGEHIQIQEWLSDRLLELKAALKTKPNIICFPEFSYPPPPRTFDGGWTVEDIDAASGRRRDFEEAALKALKKSKSEAFTFLGSFHCLMTLYNIGVIYPWGHERKGWLTYTVRETEFDNRGDKVVADKSLTKEVNSPILYRKRFPAQKIGEHTRVPAGREFNTYERSFGNVGLLICSDVLDLNQFMMLVRQGLEPHKGCDFLIVPAYNRGDSFIKMCRDLSYMAATIVVLVNASDPVGELHDSKIFVFGYEAAELPTADDLDVRGILTVKNVKVRHTKSRIRVVEVKQAAYRNARRKQIDALCGDGPAPDVSRARK